MYGSINNHSPHLAIDGKISDTDTGFFHSEPERYPWFQVQFARSKTIKSVAIVNRKDSNGWRLHDIEVRVGMAAIDTTHPNQPITVNPLCGKYLGPGAGGETVTITCETPIKANYATVQIVPNITYPNLSQESILQINEIRFTS